ncbi:MAG: acyl-CoA dehydratase activase [Planctomycetota bacterium]|nr:acyl-CoA dehydratase activase [Planctomycetota bacterium]
MVRSYDVGIDIGAVSATAALLASEDVQAIDGLRRLGCIAGARQVYVSHYRRTRGRPIEAATALLEQIIAAVGAENVTGVRLTGSGSKLVAAKLDVPVVNEFKAIAAGLAAMGIEARCVFEMGGETSKYLHLNRNDGAYDIIDYATNGDCAAGTGSFLDQQAGRLKFTVEAVGEACLAAERTAQVAGRCSVFAKSDMIHAQQKGYSPAEVLRGLVDAVARNFRTAVVRSHPVEAPVAFIGGVAANAAVVRAMREAFELDESQLIVPEAFAHVPAVGAAMLAGASTDAADLRHMAKLRAASDSMHGVFPTAEPLNLDRVVLLRDHIKPYQPPLGDEKIDAYLGIDIGSVSTNVVAIDTEGQVIAEIYTSTQGRPIEVVAEALGQIATNWAERLNVRGVGTTGSGRELIGHLVGADTINDEITAHKTGATFVGVKMLGGRVPDTIFEIGGQDSKYISLQEGVVVDFTMNDACAAGTGSFLQERAEELEISICDQFASMALASEAPVRLGERCTVFMERDVNNYLQRGAEKADLVAGLAYSVVQNYINRVVRGRHIGECIFFQGGTAYNDAVAAAFAAVTGKEIIVPPHNGVIGAIGAALLARDKMEAGEDAPLEPPAEANELGTYVSEVQADAATMSQSRFRGYDLSAVDYTLREFTCAGCSNACQIQQFTVEGEKTYWGDKCSDRYRKQAKSAQKPVIEDLFALRSDWLLDESNLPVPDAGAPVVGIPLTMFALDMLPFWRTLLAGLGYRTVLSNPTNKQITQAGLSTAVAEPCFPIILAHGHVAELAGRDDVDFILLPNILSMETRWMHNESHLCPWHQTLPFVIRRAPSLASCVDRFMTPLVRFREGRRMAGMELTRYFAARGISKRRIARAVAAAYEAQDEFQNKALAFGSRALETLDRTGATGIVVVGRPYNIHDTGVNLSVPRKLRDYYGVNCIPLEFLDTDDVDIRDVNDNMYWNLGRRILAAAKTVRDRPNLHIIHITNFKCGPDSFIRHFIRTASGKPFLSLQFDGHSNDAGIMTRCEAYLDSKGVLRPWRKEPLAAATV